MSLPNLSTISIYKADNTLWRTIEVKSDCMYRNALEGDESVELKWESYDYEEIPVGSYVTYDNRVFRLTEPHKPSRRTENVFTFNPTFYTQTYHWRKAMACYYEYASGSGIDYDDTDNTITATIPDPQSRELDWSFTGNLPDALFMLLQAVKNETGVTWKAHYASGLGNQLIEITAQGLSVYDMLSQIADQCGKEFYFDYSGDTPIVCIGTLELTATGDHTDEGRVVLNVGEDVSNPNVSSEAEEYFTRFYFFGSTRNIVQPQSITKSQVVNRRLPLLSSASGNMNYYPKGFIDISGGTYVNHQYTPSLPPYKVFAKSVFFDDIYPHSDLKVGGVQTRHIAVVDDAGAETGENMPIYYVSLLKGDGTAFEFDDRTWNESTQSGGDLLPTLVPSIAFRSGYLQGLEYQLIYHNTNQSLPTTGGEGSGGYVTIQAPCFEIVFDTNSNPRLPNDSIKPQVNDECTLFNIHMPQAYVLNAQQELETKALEYIQDLNVDKSTYEMSANPDNFEKILALKELKLGHLVKLNYPNGDSVLSRVISIERHLDLPCDCEVTLGYSAKQGTIKTLREIVADTSDKTETVIKEGEKNKAQILGLRNGYRAQQETLDTYFDPDGSFDGSRIKPETVQTGALSVGAKSQQFTLSEVNFSIAKYTPSTNSHGIVAWTSGSLYHYTIDKDYILKWEMDSGQTEPLTSASSYYIYAKVAKSGFGSAVSGVKTNSNHGTFYISQDQKKFDADPTYYYFLVGTINSEQQDGTYYGRIVSMTYGSTTINGRQITTGVIRSSDSNHGVVINLDTGEIIGKITFRTSQGTDVGAETYISDTANSAAQTAVNNLEIGGKNLLRGTEAITVVSSDFDWAHAKFYKSGTGTLENVTLPDSPIPSVTKGIKATITNATEVGIAQDAVPLSKREMTQSVWIKGTAGDTIRLQTLWSASSGASESGSKSFTIADSNWHRYVFTKTPNYDHLDGVAAGYVYVNSATNGHVFYICAEKLEYGNKATDWTPATEDVDAGISTAQTAAANAQQAATNAQTTINNMDSDSYFSTVEKKSFRPEWKAICGVDNTTTTPTASSTYGGSYEQALKAAQGTTVSTTALTTAFGNLRGHLNTYKLYTNPPEDTNWGTSGQTTLATYVKAYYNAEQALYDAVAEYWANYAVANLEIGGRNLLLNSSFSSNLDNWGGTEGFSINSTYKSASVTGALGSSKALHQAIQQHLNPSGTTTFTFSGEMAISSEATKGTTNCFVNPYFAGSRNGSWYGGTFKSFSLGGQSYTSSTYSNAVFNIKGQGFKKFIYTFEVASDATGCYIYMYARDFTGSFFFRNLKLEKGNKATDWSPAPEDTEAALTALQTDLQTQIDGKIETYYQSTNPANSWTSAQYSKHTGDLWYYTGSTSGGLKQDATYRWNGSAWVEQQAAKELFDEIDGKSTIFYGSPSGSYTGVQTGDFLVDSDTNICYKWSGSAWVKVQDVQVGGRNLLPCINYWENGSCTSGTGQTWEQIKTTTNIRIRTINTQSVETNTDYTISIGDGYSFELETFLNGGWVSNNGGWKTGKITFNTGTNNSVAFLVRKIDNSTILPSEIVNAKIKFEKGNRATDWTPAPEDVDAEIDEQTRKNLQATCSTAAGTANKDITCSDWKDSFFKTGTHITIEFTNANTADYPYLIINGTTCFLEYAGWLSGKLNTATGGHTPKWVAGQKIDFVYDGQKSNTTPSATETHHTFKIEDETAFKANLILAKSIEGTTDIEGGLVLTNTIMLRNAMRQFTAGMSGLNDDGNVAIWAGGTLQDAIAGIANAIIRFDGSAKFGVLVFDENGNISMPVSGKSRLSIFSGNLPSTDVAAWSYQGYAKANGSLTSGTGTRNTTITLVDYGTNRQGHNGMVVSCTGTGYLGLSAASGTVTTGEIQMYIRCGTNRVLIWKINSATLTTTTQYFSLSSINAECIYFNNGSAQSIVLEFDYVLSSGTVNFNFYDSNQTTSGNRGIYVSWNSDVTTPKTNIAANGLLVLLKNTDYFEVKESGGKLYTTIKGKTNISGVLWAGTITSGSNSGSASTKFANNGVSVSVTRNTTGDYTISLSGAGGNTTDEVSAFANVIKSNTTGNGWSANIIGTPTKGSIRVKTYSDNTITDTSFTLCVIGYNY